jgi:O-antigen/teichoic acid export membrane protein
MSDASHEAKQAGRGVIFIAFAKIYFILAGAVIEVFGLPVILSAVTFGAYKVVTATINPLNALLITGTIQAVSRFTAQQPERARHLQRAGFRMHLVIGAPLALLFIAAAPGLAFALGDTAKTGPIMLAGLIVLGYPFYAVFIGTVNGKKEFHKQAGLDITMATLRAIGILGMAIVGAGVYGVISGWVLATGVILVIASFVVGIPVRLPADGEAQPIKPLVSFFLIVSLYLILLNLIMVVDTLLLKSLSAGWFETNRAEIGRALSEFSPSWARSIVARIDVSALADSQVGFYGVVQNFSRLSYQLIIAATFVIFPLVSRTTFADDREVTHRYISTTMRYSLIFATAIGTVLAANPQPILDIVYSADYAHNGAPALSALALGSVAFAVFAIGGTILNGAGLTRQAIISAAITLALAAAANALLIPRLEPGRATLLACGLATGGSMLVGAGITGWFLQRHLGAFVPMRSLIRVVVASAAAIAFGQVVPFTSPATTLAEAVAVGGLFFVVLVITRELGGSDLRAVLALAHRGGRSKGDS